MTSWLEMARENLRASGNVASDKDGRELMFFRSAFSAILNYLEGQQVASVALKEIATLDHVELRSQGISVGDRAIGIAKRALGDEEQDGQGQRASHQHRWVVPAHVKRFCEICLVEEQENHFLPPLIAPWSGDPSTWAETRLHKTLVKAFENRHHGSGSTWTANEVFRLMAAQEKG